MNPKPTDPDAAAVPDAPDERVATPRPSDDREPGEDGPVPDVLPVDGDSVPLRGVDP